MEEIATTTNSTGFDNDVSPGSFQVGYVIGPIIGLAFVFLSLIFALIAVKRRNGSKKEIPMSQIIIKHSETQDRADLEKNRFIEAITQHLPEKELPQIPENRIIKKDPLGSGAFGDVFEGVLLKNDTDDIGTGTRVAIKTLQENPTELQKKKFLDEATLQNHFNHENIVKLLGVCINVTGLWLILELMEKNLQQYLESVRPTQTVPSRISLKDMLNIARKIVDGCVFLEQHHYVHRDLAARNCLVSCRNGKICSVKIADFGFASKTHRDDYCEINPNSNERFPFKWTAPEVLVNLILFQKIMYSHKSDVWSFGVLLWELISCGEKPYAGNTDETFLFVLQQLQQGKRLEKPYSCPFEMYQIMTSCWNLDPTCRPAFLIIKFLLESYNNLGLYQTDDPFPPLHPNNISDNSSSDQMENIKIYETGVIAPDVIPSYSNSSPNYIMANLDHLNYFYLNNKSELVAYAKHAHDENQGNGCDIMEIKSIPKLILKNKDDLLKREIELLKSLKHPNIVNIKEIFEDSRNMYLVERKKGRNLFNNLPEKEIYTESFAANVVKQTIQGVSYLHQHNIIHRQINPENILFYSVDDIPRIVISGYGLTTNETCEQLKKEIFGAIDFIAPEVIKNNLFTTKLDVWALGVVTYLILCGHYPFSTDNDTQAAKESDQLLNEYENTPVFKIMNGNYNFDLPQWKQTSVSAKRFITKLLQVDPIKRYSCPEALSDSWVNSSANNPLPEVPMKMKKLYETEKRKKQEANAALDMSRLQDQAQDCNTEVSTGEIVQPPLKGKWKKAYDVAHKINQSIRQMQECRGPRLQEHRFNVVTDYGILYIQPQTLPYTIELKLEDNVIMDEHF